MANLLIVALGGAVGASLRHLVNVASLRAFGPGFPWGTLTVNIVGSFIMGIFVEWLVRRSGVSNEVRLLVATGLLGGFTTFSAFSLDVAMLWERGAAMTASLYVAASVLLSIAALFAGLALARAMA
ncbi:fluoride efflux transporter CrcB [Hoeflea prorocentri]|uniref:Fluoride-specific ion channel FluC n=1 Tax=Hoeflea prorocentri TaxID=1922333 RepID=A0A9X3UGG5_9HYPH|nr:fluoride efflux transporter CrcB [Hoeflea prorocentri]MCY6380837.1 fluoride efflux transporter CrcB [Hoeflea prorocentri]MDA5398637.1 fluoride efflux transporter CrcB [Hoeflea prorocentri]